MGRGRKTFLFYFVRNNFVIFCYNFYYKKIRAFYRNLQLSSLCRRREHYMVSLFRGEITPLSSSYNISGLVPACWLLFQCF